MRARLYLVFLMTALCLISCDFSQKFGENIAVNYNDLTLKVTASAEDAYADLLQGLWQNGDVLKVRASGAEYASSTDCVRLHAVSEGETAAFEGTLTSLTQKDNLYFYYAESGEFAGKDSIGYSIVLPSAQTGKLEDVRSNVLYYSWTRNDSMSPDAQVLEIESQMIPAFALLKINVPAELQAENVTLQADRSIVGKLVVQPQMGWGTTGEGTLLSWEEDDSEDADRIVIAGEEGRVEGDVYIVLLPDSFDQSYDEYCCSIENLTFSCTYYEGDLTHRFKLSDGLLCGTLTDLGQIPMPKPKIPVEGGRIRMMTDAILTIGIENPNPDCEYYYEIGASEQECAKPTVNSVCFDPSEGFKPEVTKDFDRYYIKVLVHALDNEHSDVVLAASLRNWKFSQGCPVDNILSKVVSGEKLTTVGSKENTSHGLELYRNLSSSMADYESTSARIAYTTARVQINVATEYASDAWIGFFIDKNTCVKTGTARGYRLFYNNSQSTSGYWTHSVTSEGTSAERYNMCLHLSDIFNDEGIKAGDKFGLRGDGKHVYYGIALLEVL